MIYWYIMLTKKNTYHNMNYTEIIKIEVKPVSVVTDNKVKTVINSIFQLIKIKHLS